MVYKTVHRKLDQHGPQYILGWTQVFRKGSTSRLTFGTRRVIRAVSWPRQTEHIHDHLWHKYSVTINKVGMATIIHSMWRLYNVTSRNQRNKRQENTK